jgi:hypothetical protein
MARLVAASFGCGSAFVGLADVIYEVLVVLKKSQE